MAKAQVASEEIQAYRTMLTNLKLADMPVSKTGPLLLCDVSTGTPCPIVPIQYRRQVSNVIYSLAYPGRKATQKLVSQKFWWHSMNNNIKQWPKQYIMSVIQNTMPCASTTK